MAFSSTSQNYQRRRVDLSIFGDLRVSGLPATSGFGVVSRAIAGPSKAAQNYLLALFTPLGSNGARPGYGSNFMPRVRAGFVRYPGDLSALFAIENLRVQNYLGTLPASKFADEQIASVTLDAYSVEPTGIKMRLLLTVASGDTLPFLLPVVWNV